jgi:glutathione synthase/RimK-type ligase-like ATP-grasp enzyme
MKKRILEALLRARAASGRSIPAQVMEIISLRYGRGRIGVSEYFDYQLFDSAKFSSEQKQEFVGWRTKYPFHKLLDIPAWHAFSTDKNTFDTFARGAGIPTPHLWGLYSARARHVLDAEWLSTPAQLDDFLRKRLPYPAFAKPAVSYWGQGTFVLKRYEADTDVIVCSDDTHVPVNEFVLKICEKGGGYLFQEVLMPDPVIAAATGGRLCTMRMVVLNGPSTGPQLHRVVWKIATGTNVHDNFHHGASGNLLAHIDLSSGRVAYLIKGGWPWPEKTDRHPDTGQVLTGTEVPQWNEAVALVLKAAAAFPGARLQGWDVALSDRGPVFLELNTPMDADLIQLACEQGLWDAKFDAFYRDVVNLKGKGPWFESI